MRKLIASMWSGPGMPRAAAPGSQQFGMSIRRGPVLWLILCGVLLVAAITIGTAVVIGEFRERALGNSERELENTVRLLASHFDQQFEDCDTLAADLISKMQLSTLASPEAFKSRMSTFDTHLTLKSRVSALSYIGDVMIFDSDGKLINSSGPWPLPDLSIADRAYFKTFRSDPQSSAALAEPARRICSGEWSP